MLTMSRLAKSHMLLVAASILGCVVFLLLLWGLLALWQHDNEEEANYRDASYSWFAGYEDALARIDSLAQSPHHDDPVWRQNLQAQFDAIRTISAEIRAYHPPFTYTYWHEGVKTDIAAGYDRFVNLYIQAINDNDPAKLSQAEAQRSRADEYRQKTLTTMRQK
jgi:hypothetical protein